MLDGEPRVPGRLLGSLHPGPRLLDQLPEECGVGIPRHLLLAALGQPLGGEFAHRLQHPEPRLVARTFFRPQQAVLAQPLHQPHDVQPATRIDHRLGGFQREPARKGRQPPEHGLFLGVEQVMAPGDRVAQGALPRRSVAGPSRQERQALLQPGQERFGGKQADPRRRKLDRQWETVETPANLGHRGGARVVHHEAWPYCLRPFDEEADGGVGGELLGGGRGRRSPGQCQGRYRPLAFSAQPERRPAGGEHGQARTGGEQVRDELGHGRQQMLAVVENQQELLPCQVVAQHLDHRSAPLLGNLQGLGHGGRNQRWLARARPAARN